MTTVPFTGQPTNGVSITRISMVTTSDPAVNLLMALAHPISQASWVGVQQDQITPIKIVHHCRYILTKDSKIQDSPIPIATSVCQVTPIIPFRTLGKIDSKIDREIHITLITVQTQWKINQTITYLRGHWAFISSMVTLYPSLDYVFSSQEVRAHLSTSVPYLPMSSQDWVMGNWSPPHKTYILQKNISMLLRLCSQNSVKQERFLRYTYVPSRVTIQGTISS